MKKNNTIIMILVFITLTLSLANSYMTINFGYDDILELIINESLVTFIHAFMFFYLLYNLINRLIYRELPEDFNILIKSTLIFVVINIINNLINFEQSLIFFIIILIVSIFIVILKKFTKLKNEGYYDYDVSIFKKSIIYMLFVIVFSVVLILVMVIIAASLTYKYWPIID